MYEVPAHGAMLLSDKAALDAHEAIFTPGIEAVYYDNIADGDCENRVLRITSRPGKRVAIARAGFERTRRDYLFEASLLGLLNWADALRNRKITHE